MGAGPSSRNNCPSRAYALLRYAISTVWSPASVTKPPPSLTPYLPASTRISFAPSASPTAAVDWFRGLREIEHRLSEACARTQCSVNEHRPDPPRTWRTNQDQWQTFVEDDVCDREQQIIDDDLVVD